MPLPLLDCPGCRKPMSHPGSVGSVSTATKFEDCLRQCEPCGIGASNGTGSPTHIHFDPLGNVPAEARRGAREVIGRALNVQSRNSKWLRFGYSTSEDAVTWVVFTYLLRSGRLVEALKGVGILAVDTLIDDPKLLLWGVPVDAPDGGEELRRRIKALCASFGESRTSFSEPDVVIDLGCHGVVFIEVKHRSGNEFKDRTHPGWPKYAPSLRNHADFEQVRNGGCYELARNWCLVKSLADDRTATLINLGPASLFRSREGERLGQFAASLRTDEGSRFQTLAWAEFLRPISRDAPEWLADFCRGRGLLPSVATPAKRASDPGPGNGAQPVDLECAFAETPPSDPQEALDLLSLKDSLRNGRKAGRAALALDAESLACAYERFVPSAPRRNRPYLSSTRNGITSSGAFSNREEEHLAVALFQEKTMQMPDGSSIQLADYQFPLKAVRADAGIGKVDLLGVDDDGTIVVVELKIGRSREDRRVGLIEALVYAAVIEANIDPIARELEILLGRNVRRCRPNILILAPSLYWASSDPSALQELEALASSLSLRLGISLRLRSLDAQLASYGLNGARPLLDGTAWCRPIRDRFVREATLLEAR